MAKAREIKMTSRDGHFLFAWRLLLLLLSLFTARRIFLFPFSQEPAHSSRIDSFPFLSLVYCSRNGLQLVVISKAQFPSSLFFFFLNLFPKAISRLHACHKTRTKGNEQGNFVTSNLDFRWSVQNAVREIVFYLRDNRTICVHITIFRMWLVFHNVQGNSAIIRSRY